MEWEKENGEGWDPNLFLSRQFIIHKEVLSMPSRDDFVELSSGVNYLPIPSIWKEMMYKELEEDFLYQQYTSLEGFQATRYAIKTYERFLFSQGDIFLDVDFDVCMTIGASQAADLALDYYCSIGKKRMLLVGLTYPLYATLGEKYKYTMDEARSSMPNKDLPTINELITAMQQFKPDLIIISYPSNPSGEKYTDEDMDVLMQVLYERDIYCIFDCACNMIISENKVTVPEPFILKHKMMSKSVIVNSLSKTEGVPGFRIGYIAGDYDLIEFVKLKQVSIMNPPNMPALAIWVTMLFRCLFLSEKYGQSERERMKIIRFYKGVFFTTTIRCSQMIRNYVKELIETRIWDEYEKYKQELFFEERICFSNKKYLLKQLFPFITTSTSMDGGYNYLIKFQNRYSMSELDFCKEVLQKTGIAVFTESAFALKEANQNDYWVRISLAVPKETFCAAVDRLRVYLLNKEKQ